MNYSSDRTAFLRDLSLLYVYMVEINIYIYWRGSVGKDGIVREEEIQLVPDIVEMLS